MIEIMENLEQLAADMETVAEKMLNYRGPNRNEVAVHGFQLQGAAEMVWTWAKGIEP